MAEGHDADANLWRSEDGEVEIKNGCIVRMRVLGVMVNDNEITAVGSLKDDFLGLLKTEPYTDYERDEFNPGQVLEIARSMDES